MPCTQQLIVRLFQSLSITLNHRIHKLNSHSLRFCTLSIYTAFWLGEMVNTSNVFRSKSFSVVRQMNYISNKPCNPQQNQLIPDTMTDHISLVYTYTTYFSTVRVIYQHGDLFHAAYIASSTSPASSPVLCRAASQFRVTVRKMLECIILRDAAGGGLFI